MTSHWSGRVSRKCPHWRWRYRSIVPGLLIVAGAAARAPAQSDEPAVFVCHYHPTASIASFTVNPDGTVNFVALDPTGSWSDPIALSPNGRFLAVANGEGSTNFQDLRILRVNADATLTEVLLDQVPTTPLDLVWIDNQTLAVTETQISISSVHTYHWDEVPGTLVHLDEESSGVFTTSLVRHPSLPYLYANDASGASAIRRYLINGGGTLTLAEIENTGAVYPLDMVMTSNGAWLYAGGGISNGGHSVLGFSADAGDGALAPLAGSPFFSPGQSPAYLALSRGDAFLFVSHGTDATVRSFRVNRNGSLTDLGYVFDVGLQGTIGDQAGLHELLFVTDDSAAIDGITGLYSFAVNADGSFSMIGGINDTFAIRPTRLAVWAPTEVGGDFDGDGDVDLDDYAYFADCMAGPNLSPNPTLPDVTPQDCLDAFDFASDADVDLADFAPWQEAFTGPSP